MKSLLRILSVFALVFGFAAIPANSDDAQDQRMLEQLELFAEAFSIIRESYVDETTDEDLIEGAINGALETLDPHSHYVPPQAHVERQKSARREYGGLGIEVVMEEEGVKVNYVIPDGPAAKQGLKRNDFIIAVEGESIKGKSLDEAVSGMRGLAGDPIKVTIKSANSTRDVTIIREVVSGRAVRHRVEDGVGYIYIETFNHPRLSQDVKTALNELKTEFDGEVPGLIIDVRSNPGGRVDQVVKVTGYFLDGGEVFSSRTRDAQDTKRYHAKDGEILPGTPIVVLTNSQSASAAEIIAGALQDRNRGLVLGRRSFGKGSVQSIMQVKDNGALRLTTERYYTPSGESIQGKGIMPDILVAAREENDRTRKRFRESNLQNALTNPDTAEVIEDFASMVFPDSDWPEGEDFQLSQAIELVTSERYKTLIESKNIPIR